MIIEGNFCGKKIVIEARDGVIKRVDVEEMPQMRFADNCIIFPGFIDLHVHLREDKSRRWNYKETFQTGAEAALNGGVIAFLDQPNTPIPCVDRKTLNEKKALARNAPIDIYFNAGIGPETHPVRGHKFYKLFTTESVGGIYLTDYKSIEEKLKEYADKVPDLHLCVHCEDDKVIKEVRKRTINSEVKSIIEMIEIGEKLKIPNLHIYHVSTKAGVRNIREAKQNYSGLSCSATPHHLFFDSKNAIYAVQSNSIFMNPPLRGREHVEALHYAIKDGTIDCIA
jgi:dihydroorotase